MRFFQRFFVKLSLLFFSLLVVTGIIQIVAAMRVSEKRQIEIDQLVNRDLARDMAVELKPFLLQGVDPEQIGPVIHYMMVMNPKIEIYLLDGEGEILAYFTEPGIEVELERVDIRPLRAFLENENNIPIYGDDPRNPNLQKPFSAASIDIGREQTGFIYIVLRSSLYDRAESMLEEYYLFSTLNKSLLLSLPFVAFIGFFLFAFLTKRLQSVSRAVRDFEEGHYERRIQPGSEDEIGSLARSFNQMAETIQNQLKELKKTDELRRELVANVSHDLKSPLATIQGYIETLLMKRDTLSEEEQRRFLETAFQSTQFLDRLIGELMELSKLEARQVEPKIEVFSLTDLTQDVVMMFKPIAEKKKISLTADIPEEHGFVRGDISLIERVMSNLSDNAIKHTPENGSVILAVSFRNGKLRFSVTDSGEGLPPEDRTRVFERFHNSSRGSSGGDGAGLGLAISKKIIDLHGGTIGVDNCKGGCTFFFELARVTGSGVLFLPVDD